MSFALFPGCVVQSEQYAFEISARETLPVLGIQIKKLDGLSCCGYSLKNVSIPAWFYMSARNLALAEKNEVDLLPLCNGCNLSFREVKNYLVENSKLRERINSLLSMEGLKYTGKAKSWHILEVFNQVVGIEKIKSLVKVPLTGLKFAAHYGCHALRPSPIGLIDDPENPHILEELIGALGASAVDYPQRLDCCGQGLSMTTGKTALTISGEKLKAIQDQLFAGVVTVCPFCMKMLDSKQRAIRVSTDYKEVNLPVFYYTQLLGLAMGLDIEPIGLTLNSSPVGEILKKIGGNKK
jgi:heterodisulfide reductase subunit B